MKVRKELKVSLTDSLDIEDSMSAPSSTVVSMLSGKIQYSETRRFLPDPVLLEKNRIIAHRDGDPASNAFKMLRTQVLQSLRKNDCQTVGIISPGAGNGRTLTAINLAISIARDINHTALLVDLDMYNPSIAKYFGYETQLGILDYFTSAVSLEKLFVNPDIERLVLLPGKENCLYSSEMLSSRHMANLVAELKRRYPERIVLFDLPPLLKYDDALAFLPHIDAVLLVVEDGKTERQDLERTLELLGDTKVIGVTLNKGRV